MDFTDIIADYIIDHIEGSVGTCGNSKMVEIKFDDFSIIVAMTPDNTIKGTWIEQSA